MVESSVAATSHNSMNSNALECTCESLITKASGGSGASAHWWPKMADTSGVSKLAEQ